MNVKAEDRGRGSERVTEMEVDGDVNERKQATVERKRGMGKQGSYTTTNVCYLPFT